MDLEKVMKNPAYASQLCINDRGEGRKFVFLHASYPYMNEMISLVKHHSNARVDMTWDWILDFYASKEFLKKYLTTAPINKIFTFGGDYITVEQVVGHAYMARLGISQVLSELVNEEYFTEKEAFEVAEKIMYTNAKEFYKLK